MEVMDEFKIFNDPVHGHIEVHPLCIKIIDTPQFQRLRYIKQLGACYFVFPGASHNRFEHSLGVGFLAGQLVRQLRHRQNHLNITDEDVLCVEIAGLCHDLGHGPFSHMFDGRFIPAVRGNRDWRHETASVDMFDYLVKINHLEEEFQKYNLTSTDLDFIKEQIAKPPELTIKSNEIESSWPFKGRPKEKGYLYEIVANKRNGIDVDKWDYFARDCHHLGIRSNFDHNRFMKFARVLEVEGQQQICSRDKEVGNCYDMFYTRNVLHRRAYQHKNTTGIECMITEALLLANDHLLIMNEKGEKLKMSDAIYDMSAYTKLNDSIFHLILYSNDEKLLEARKILENVERRQLYKCIGQTRPLESKTEMISETRMSKEIAKYSNEISPSTHLSPADIVIYVVKYDYGMKEDNPIDHVRFYQKSNPTQPMHVRKNQVSQMLPDIFSEQCIRAYCKKEKSEDIQVAKKCFERFCKDNNMTSPKDGDPESFGMTPDKSSLEQIRVSPDNSKREAKKRKLLT